MSPSAVVGYAVLLAVLASVTPVAAQEISGVEHWVEHAGLKLYVWEKYVGSPTGKPVVVLAHGSATAGRESFDLQVPGSRRIALWTSWPWRDSMSLPSIPGALGAPPGPTGT